MARLHLAQLVVAHVVREPPRLLPEEREQHGANNEAERAGALAAQHGAYEKHGLRGELVRVEAVVQLKQPSGNHLASQVAVRLLKGALILGLLREGSVQHRLQRPDAETIQRPARGGRVEEIKGIRDVVSRVSKDHRAAGVIVPIRDVIDAVPQRHPRV